MIGRLAIIGIIIISGFFLILPNNPNLFFNAPEVIDTIQEDLTDFANDKIDNVKKSSEDFLLQQEETFFGKIKEQTTEPQPSTEKVSGDKGGGLSQINNGGAGGLSQINNGGAGGSSQINNGGAGGSSQSNNGGAGGSSQSNSGGTTPVTSEISFDTLSLIIKKQADNTVLMKFVDTSGGTIGVTVIMRNEGKTLITGQFFSSSFENITLDRIDTDHFVDLVVEHSEYGQVFATAFSPEGSTETVIYGVFFRN